MNGRMTLMSLTADVKDELARLRVDKISARKAEVAVTLRFARCAAFRLHGVDDPDIWVA